MPENRLTGGAMWVKVGRSGGLMPLPYRHALIGQGILCRDDSPRTRRKEPVDHTGEEAFSRGRGGGIVFGAAESELQYYSVSAADGGGAGGEDPAGEHAGGQAGTAGAD